MQNTKEILKNIQNIYESNNSLNILKDFERVIDELDVYVFKNWIDGELVSGPTDSRYWVTCEFMWPEDKMPDKNGGYRLIDYGCKVGYKRDVSYDVRKIRNPDDIRPGTKKGKIDQQIVWVVQIKMPKKLISDISEGYKNLDVNQIPSQVVAVKNKVVDQSEQDVQDMTQNA
jgi:hypothetical protein